jgi:hypothetical protein
VRSDTTTQDQHNRDDDQDEDDSSDTDVHGDTFPEQLPSITSTSTDECRCVFHLLMVAGEGSFRDEDSDCRIAEWSSAPVARIDQ